MGFDSVTVGMAQGLGVAVAFVLVSFYMVAAGYVAIVALCEVSTCR